MKNDVVIVSPMALWKGEGDLLFAASYRSHCDVFHITLKQFVCLRVDLGAKPSKMALLKFE